MHSFEIIHLRWRLFYLSESENIVVENPDYKKKHYTDYTYPKRIGRWFKPKNAYCPKPFSYQLVDIDREKALAVGFQAEQKQKTCVNSSDCDDDEFCGHVFNPTYCGNYIEAKKLVRNGCLDKSGKNKTALQFCFKSPIKDSTFKITRDSIGLTLCQNHPMCDIIPNTVCLQMDVTNYRYIKPDGSALKMEDPKLRGNVRNVPHNMTGMCLEAHVCDNRTHVSTLGTIGKDDNMCEVGNPDSCPIEGSECIASTLNNMTFCCELIEKPTTTTTTTTTPTTTTLAPTPAKKSEQEEEAEGEEEENNDTTVASITINLRTFGLAAFIILYPK